MLAIFKRELRAYFYSPIAYVLIGFFLLISSVFFALINLFGLQATFSGNLGTMAFILIMIIPVLTMKILADERRNGTEVLLVTSPVSLPGIVLGKYFAALIVFLIMTVITFIYPLILTIFGNPAMAPIVGSYIGFILLGASFIAVGLFASSLTESQVIAAVISIVSLLIMMVLRGLADSMGGVLGKVLRWISLFSRSDDFNVGILGLAPVVYYLSFIGVFIYLTIKVIEKRRWSQG